MSRRVAVLGMGAVASTGRNLAEYWEALLEARSGIRHFDRFDLEGFPVRVAAPVETSFEERCPPCPWCASTTAASERINARLFAAAASQALRSCGWLTERGSIGQPPGDVPVERRGLYAAIRPEEDEAHFTRLLGEGEPGEDSEAEDKATFSPLFPLRLASDLELRGPQLILQDAGATGTSLLGEAFHDLADGWVDAALVVAANADLTLESLCHHTMLAGVSRSPSPDACRPFDSRRDGSVRAEGAAALVLQAWNDLSEDLPQRALAEIAGYGASADAHRPTAGHPEERGLVLAIGRCLADAGLSPDEVDHINAHGAGTPLNDQHEARALHRVFGERAASIPLTANKAVTGHASLASGLLEAVATVQTLRTGLIPPTAHFEAFDPQLPRLDVVAGKPRAAEVRTALSLSTAFGLNAAVLLKRP